MLMKRNNIVCFAVTFEADTLNGYNDTLNYTVRIDTWKSVSQTGHHKSLTLKELKILHWEIHLGKTILLITAFSQKPAILCYHLLLKLKEGVMIFHNMVNSTPFLAYFSLEMRPRYWGTQTFSNTDFWRAMSGNDKILCTFKQKTLSANYPFLLFLQIDYLNIIEFGWF